MSERNHMVRFSSLIEGGGLGFNWRSAKFTGPNDLGTGALVTPDAKKEFDSWKSSGGKTRASWEEHAKRLGVMPSEIVSTWLDSGEPDFGKEEINSAPSAKPNQGPPIGASVSRAESKSVLASVFSEATSWWGYSIPNLHMVNTPQTPGNGGFGFHTVAAERAWKFARQVADENPKDTTANIVRRACARANVVAMDLTPEDASLLDMAINWYLSGKARAMQEPTPPSSGNRIGGAPGGPFRSSGNRGAP